MTLGQIYKRLVEERENEVEAMPDTGRKEIATRRYELMKDDTVAREGEFMPRLDLSKTMNSQWL